MENEIWKEIDGYQGVYEVSNLGNVKSNDHYPEGRTGNGKQNGRTLKGSVCYKGYKRVCLIFNKKHFTTGAHRLVAKAFIPNPLNKPQVNHINGIKTDNRVENLEWVTNKENQIHAIKNKLIKHNYGENHHMSKLTNKKANEIREKIKNGESPIKLAKENNISYQSIWKINKCLTYNN